MVRSKLRPALGPTLALVALLFAGARAAAEEVATPTPAGWYARIVTSKGTILARLLPEQAPQSVAYFAALAEGRLEWKDPVSGEARKTRYYDGSVVSRAVAGQRFEVGDSVGTGHAAPSLYVPLEVSGPINFNRPGGLGLTREPGQRISAVQFFVAAAGLPWLNNRHPCFGQVVEGLEIAFQISQVRTYSNGRPIEPVTIERVEVFAVGDPPPLPEPRPHHPRPGELQLRPEKQPR